MAGPTDQRNARASEFLLYAGGVAAVLVALAVVIAVLRPNGGNGAVDQPIDPSSTSTAADAGGTTTTKKPPEVFPQDRVAYVTSSGSVLSGKGAEPPVQVADGAALGADGQASIAIAPTGDLIAYVRKDGGLATVSVDGGEVRVLAADAWMPSVGSPGSIAWDLVGAQIAYLAKGTADMVAPRTGEPTSPSGPGFFPRPLPEGTLGAVVKLIDRDGKVGNRLGDPSTRSMTGIAYSSTDDLILLESKVPGEDQRYSLATASSSLPTVNGTPLSADDPTFSPDGNFILAVGPSPTGRELLRLSTENLTRAVLVSDDHICHPSISPDSTRVVYGAGTNCSKLMLISSLGGTPVDITPPDRPDQTFAATKVQWTQDAHFIAFPDCRITGAGTRCSGTVSFFDPDRSVIINGPRATTVATVSRPLLQDMTVHLAMQGPITYEGTFPVDIETEGQLTDIADGRSTVELMLTDDDRSLALKLDVKTGREFASGTMTLIDPDKGINRTFVVTGTASLIGTRVASMSGIWISTTDLPFATGEFRISVVRG